MTKNPNHNEHWKNTVESLDLRGILLAGMAVFIAYFDVRQSTRPFPGFFVVDPFLSAAAFAVVVSRTHVMSSIEPDMAAWWDRTIESAPTIYRSLDYAMEGPWIFLLLAMPFSCISPVTFGVTFASWSLLESCYLAIGKRALDSAPSGSLVPELSQKVRRYYIVRLQHERLCVLLALVVVGALLTPWASGTAIAWAALLAIFLTVTIVEVLRNPWYSGDLTVNLAGESSLRPEEGDA